MQWRADALPGILKFGKDLNCVANTFFRRDGTGWAPNVGTVGTWQPIKQGQPNFLGSKWYPLPGAVLDSRLTTSNPDCRLGSKKVNFQIWPMFHDFPYEIYEWRYDSHYLPLFWCENMWKTNFEKADLRVLIHSRQFEARQKRDAWHERPDVYGQRAADSRSTLEVQDGEHIIGGLKITPMYTTYGELNHGL